MQANVEALFDCSCSSMDACSYISESISEIPARVPGLDVGRGCPNQHESTLLSDAYIFVLQCLILGRLLSEL